jgi:hypothetical protein
MADRYGPRRENRESYLRVQIVPRPREEDVERY